eukprot:CAMPEP_0172483536 /NCGR_PEP_ID=MMETSP1066-20121228/10530_1 /TAXON_ID=671091 /ORGANISM="Coscinodiscus wailesii, Strain CCMP2513" /LENGTH=422 /DNA_ID=CAMNT_0013247445 /DNA_START=40 /DNA_END=1305 /DNA_ORIENTATION=+
MTDTQQSSNDYDDPATATATATTKQLTYLEFYAGIGGWGHALSLACSRRRPSPLPSQSQQFQMPFVIIPTRLAAYDTNDVALSVLRHNCRHERGGPRVRTTDVSKLDLSKIPVADVWVMSPPCQPHTRQNESPKDERDARSSSFLHLCEVLSSMAPDALPQLILTENVIGFESSRCCEVFLRVLSRRGYTVRQFHLNPTQFGIPNDRPRYYSVAIRRRVTDNISTMVPAAHEREYHSRDDVIETSLVDDTQAATMEKGADTVVLPRIADYLDDNLSNPETMDQEVFSSLLVPPKELERKASWCFDIVTPNDRRSSCFTHSYGRFIRGTGSVLYASSQKSFQLQRPEERKFNANWAKEEAGLRSRLRYFSGTEVARLMGFPEGFGFPEGVTSRKQQWRLLGNSLNVTVAASVANVGIEALFEE